MHEVGFWWCVGIESLLRRLLIFAFLLTLAAHCVVTGVLRNVGQGRGRKAADDDSLRVLPRQRATGNESRLASSGFLGWQNTFELPKDKDIVKIEKFRRLEAWRKARPTSM